MLLSALLGPRVIEQTVREKLPEGFQRAEFLLEKGAIDMIVARKDMRDQISDLIAKMMGYTLKGSNFVKADSQITKAPAALSVESVESKKSDKKNAAVAKGSANDAQKSEDKPSKSRRRESKKD